MEAILFCLLIADKYQETVVPTNRKYAANIIQICENFYWKLKLNK